MGEAKQKRDSGLNDDPGGLPARRRVSFHDDAQTFHEDRLRGIGGSDAPVIMGVSPWSSPLQLWAEKVGLIPRWEPQEGSRTDERLRFGLLLEDTIAKEYARRTGRTIRRRRTQYVHPERGWQRCHIDFLVKDDERGQGVLEVKSPGGLSWSRWADEAPDYAQVQLQHNLETSGKHWGSIVALVGKDRLIWFDYERHSAFVELMNRREADFWQWCVEKIEPPLTVPDADREALNRMYPSEGYEDEVELPLEAMEAHAALEEIRREIVKLTSEKTYQENRIKQWIGPHLAGRLMDGSRYRWKSITRKGYTVEEKTYRDFRHIQARPHERAGGEKT